SRSSALRVAAWARLDLCSDTPPQECGRLGPALATDGPCRGATPSGRSDVPVAACTCPQTPQGPVDQLLLAPFPSQWRCPPPPAQRKHRPHGGGLWAGRVGRHCVPAPRGLPALTSAGHLGLVGLAAPGTSPRARPAPASPATGGAGSRE